MEEEKTTSETTPVVKFICSCCHQETEESERFEESDYCQTCYDEGEIFKCYSCGEIDLAENHHQDPDGEYICESCWERYYYSCEECGRTISRDDYYSRVDRNEILCRECYEQLADDDDDDSYYRDVSDKKIVSESSESPEYLLDIAKTRTFGVEIEFAHRGLGKIADELPKTCGIVEDGSVSDGDEINTPPLVGKAGEDYLKKVCQVLKDNGGYINRTCGLHIHLEALDLEIRDLQTLIAIILEVEPIIYAMLPPSRRTNRYCHPVSDYFSRKEVNNLEINQEAFEAFWYNETDKDTIEDRKKAKYDSSRYNGLNYHALLHNKKTIEFRYHSGTIEAEKILYWVAFCQLLVALATARVAPSLKEEVLPLKKLSLLKEKLKNYLALSSNDEKKLNHLFSYLEKRIKKFAPALQEESEE